jgi:hypothetical protein
MNKDPVMIDLDRYLTTQEEDYRDPYDVKMEHDEWRADNEDYDYDE